MLTDHATPVRTLRAQLVAQCRAHARCRPDRSEAVVADEIAGLLEACSDREVREAAPFVSSVLAGWLVDAEGASA